VTDLFPDAKASPITLDEQLECVRREIQMRTMVYARRILAKQMTQKTADLEIARMTRRPRNPPILEGTVEMKLLLAIANITAVTPLMLKMGTGDDATQVPATSITFRGEVEPTLLDELRPGLSDFFFSKQSDNSPRVPLLPELVGALGWKTEYESGLLALDLSALEDLDFDDENLAIPGVEVKGITFEPQANGMCDFKMNAIVKSEPKLRGKLNGLLRHTLRATFSKLTQKPLIEAPKPSDDAASAQTQLGLEPPKVEQHEAAVH
jgi:hypothetical protein